MQTVTKLPTEQGQDALRHLAAAWAYYSSEPPAAVLVGKGEECRAWGQLEPHYTAA